MNLDWKSIRPLSGSQASGFEELCTQLARIETPADAQFLRKGTPDAGVECFSIFLNGSEWGWQAKYFNSLGGSQWAQLDSSVKTALEKHPALVRYVICCPLDRPDARIEGRMSAMQRWEEHVKKWEAWAAKKEMSVEFVWWGSSELLEELSQAEHAGRLYFWFGTHGFDEAWFQTRLDEAVVTAGPRYTPEVHIELPIARDLSLFARTDESIDKIKALAKDIRKDLSPIKYARASDDGSYIPVSKEKIVLEGNVALQVFSELQNFPAGEIPLKYVMSKLEGIIAGISDFEEPLRLKAQEYKKESKTETAIYSGRNNPYWEEYTSLERLRGTLEFVHEQVSHADSIANNSLLILSGKAGTGKTHLLCDFTCAQTHTGAPTVLLMGQRFTAANLPWVQVLEQTDLSGISASEFVGALESAAQASGKRALLVIDAVNEGQGRQVWPSNIGAFLTAIQKSPWIGVLLSVRSTYEDVILPEEVRERGVRLTHHGFSGHEYDATQTFFAYYGLEWTSTPIIQPEFSNPLFLKTVCKGLRDDGQRRLPRGFYGISVAFDLYLGTINKRLSAILDFNPQDDLVHKALEAVIGHWDNPVDRWINRIDAERVVNELLPGREFGRSLYKGLIDEGVLLEEMSRRGTAREEAVYVSYERFADHILARHLLKTHLDLEDLERAFADDGGLAFLRDDKQYIAPGLLEAFCIQFPEQTGKELPDVVPCLLNHWDMGDAFRQSVIWRDPSAFSPKTREIFNELIETDHDDYETIDMLLTVSSLEDHPFNAEYLDKQLRQDTMPDRDAWWSTHLHRAWRSQGPVDRLVDWAIKVSPSDELEDSLVDLCAITLAWFFSTPNRFLRDHATKALVSLLTGRLEATERLVFRFADVDDPYVVERVYAAAYGVATRSYDVESVGLLADRAYALVFADNKPPAHILLRDYARGIIERALYLGSEISINEQILRPPYNSVWPTIPTEEEIKHFKADWKRGSYDGGDLSWGQNRIYHSVMADDFARYVIGTNSSTESRSWLSLRHDDEPWLSSDEQIEALLATSEPKSRLKWEEYIEEEKRFRIVAARDRIQIFDKENARENTTKREAREKAEQALNEAFERFIKTLGNEQVAIVEQALSQRTAWGTESPPRFDLKEVQRYVLWRVFDLGWTIERFGEFDRYGVQSHGRDAAKAERMGKKYQWIAYHEMFAFLSDHYQYNKQYENSKGYEGPWQDYLRDIDPSCTVLAIKGGTSWGGHNLSWWGSASYDAWDKEVSHQEWLARENDLPCVEVFLNAENPVDTIRWVNLYGHLNWQQPFPADVDPSDEDKREAFYLFTAYFVRKDELPALMSWAKTVDFWGRWMPNPAEGSGMFLGEYGWSPAYNYFNAPYYGGSEWRTPDQNCPASVRVASEERPSASSGFDCSVKDSYTLHMPIFDLIEKLGLQWSGVAANFVDRNGQLACFDPTVYEDGPTSLLVREDLLKQYLSDQELALFWVILGEKRVLSGNLDDFPGALRMSGAYSFSEEKRNGFVNYVHEEPRIRS